jgi:LmbE family N-acetylglucosaminyl deacetylase
MTRKTIALFFVSFLFVATTFAQAPRSYTSSEILLQLKKLNTVGSVLYIAAHPDDENTRLIAYLANEKCLRTGYLSLTRGDGGQNLIGPEQGVELGVIRTQELLAARRIDGGEQFFTRAYDFGFSKSPEETLQKWNKDSILSDMVWVIRNFRPDIIITRFATDGSGGHGHHTTSAILAEEAFDAAGDPSRFQEQLLYVEVWKPRRLFWNVSTRFQNPNADMSPYLKLDVGGYNPLLGKSYGEIAAESRSMHKSQGFGSAKQRGEYFEYFKPIKGDTAGLKDIFECIDFSWKRVKGGEKIGGMIDNIIKDYKVFNTGLSSEKFEQLHMLLQQNIQTSIEYQMLLANRILLYLNGISIESTAKNYQTALGDSVQLSLQLLNRSDTKVTGEVYNEFSLLRSEYGLYQTELNWNGWNNKPYTKQYQSMLSISNHEISNPFYLVKPIKNNLFDIELQYYRAEPETSPYHMASAILKFKNTTAQFVFNTQYKWTDPEKGELYRPVVITPPVMINPQSKLVTFTDNKVKELRVSLKAGRDSVSGLIQIALPKGWYVVLKGSKFDNQLKAPTESAFTFSLAKKGDVEDVVLEINPYEGAKDTTISITALVNGQTYTKGIKEIKYDHIPIQTLFPEAEVKLVKLDVVKKNKRIGYIPGAGDEIQACLSQLGYEVTTLTDDKLASENLNNYDAIITGVRAYNTNPKLLSFKQKLMDYVAAGGNLIVQYNTNSWAGPLSSDIGPYKFKITRNRITDEEAKVNFLLPNHPVFNSPNKITEKDFEGWMQERSIYHAGDWDSNYVAPISMTDPYEMTVGGVSPKGKPDNGALIIAKHGKGNFVYTGLVFFRQLPAGVPGAYRLMVNLIELGK